MPQSYSSVVAFCSDWFVLYFFKVNNTIEVHKYKFPVLQRSMQNQSEKKRTFICIMLDTYPWCVGIVFSKNVRLKQFYVSLL